MDWFNIIYFLAHYAADASKHFGLALVTGLLGYSLIWITLSAVYWALRRLIHWRGNMAVGSCIRGLCLLAGLSLALLSHAALDSYALWFTTPLGSPLELIVK